MAHSPGTFRISRHALEQMAVRGIPEGLVHAVLAAPDAVQPADRPARQILQRIVAMGDPPFRALLRIVVDMTDSPPAVVTVYATTQFRRYGAEP